VRVYQFRHIRVTFQSSSGVLSADGLQSRRPLRTAPPRRYHQRQVSTERLQTLLEGAFPDAAEVRVIDRGGGDHFEVRVTTPDFNGLTRIQQHKLVYEALDEPWQDGSIHELRINTKGTPQ
jgi:stress-induced morphogen